MLSKRSNYFLSLGVQKTIISKFIFIPISILDVRNGIEAGTTVATAK